MLLTEGERTRDYQSIFPHTTPFGINAALKLGHALNKLNAIKDVPTYSLQEKNGMQHIAFSIYCDLRNEGAEALGEYVLMENQPRTEDTSTVIFKQPKIQESNTLGKALEDAMVVVEKRWEEIHEEDKNAALGCGCSTCKQRFQETLQVETKDKIPDELQLLSTT